MAGDRAPRPTREARLAARVAAATAAGLGDVQARYASWTVGNLVEAIDRHLGDAAELCVPARDRAGYVEAIARTALRPNAGHDVVQITGHEPVAVPDVLRRTGPGEDGAPRFRPANDQRYSTGAHLAAEDHVVGLARTVCGPVIDDPAIGTRLDVAGLSPDQRAAVLGVLGTDRGGAVLVGPAGAGKSRTVGALAYEWTTGTDGRVFGLATSEIATQNLRQDGLTALNTTAFLGRFDKPDPSERLAPGDLVVVDEAGMTSTDHLERVARLAAAAGARVLYTGDPEQLDAVEAGGLFAHLAASVDPGQRHDLAELHRFRNDWEAEASLLLRDGDPDAVDAYADRGRLHSGSVEEVDAGAARAYLADTVSGRTSLLIVGTNAHAATLSAQIRDQLRDLGAVTGPDLSRVRLGEARATQPIAAGDRIQTRLNRYDLRVDPAVDEHGGQGEARPVTNRAMYEVLGLDEHGHVLARDERGAVAHLPAEYLAEHAALAYATTVHGAQGVTVDTAHAVLDHDAAREQAYVGLTRGRDANHAWLVTEREPDEHDPERMTAEGPDRLRDILGRDGHQAAATATRAAAEADLASLAAVAARFDVVTGWASRDRHQALLAERLDEHTRAGLAADPGRGRLLRALRETEFAGYDPAAVLDRATEGALVGADSVADVLRARIRRATAERAPDREVDPTDWASRTVLGDDDTSRYVREVAGLASQRQAALGRDAAARAARWAVAALGDAPAHPDGEGPATLERASWEDRAGVAAAYRDLARVPDDQASLGPAPSRDRELERALWRDAVDALGHGVEQGATDWRAAPDADLYAARERWAREQDTAPRWVADELAERHDLARQYREDAALERARLDALAPDDPEAADLTERAERSGWFADQHTAAAADLEVAHAERRSWWDSRAPQRDADAAAADELGRRNLPPERIPEPDPEAVVDDEPDEPVVDEPAAPELQAAEEPAAEAPEPTRLDDALARAQEAVRAAHERVEHERQAEQQRLDDEARQHAIAADEPQVPIEQPEVEYGDDGW